ncbi:hypothetical protein CEXT_125581 [Caerostris extrusa]|uniref:Uncharacterized protein n=1 Tax=Caerostris extrusa TaxID=172846 RepID=A0AAV4QVT5_CAEEX|nr:hypothetical protein CEXT_125581 [Caerostris extrusa]
MRLDSEETFYHLAAPAKWCFVTLLRRTDWQAGLPHETREIAAEKAPNVSQLLAESTETSLQKSITVRKYHHRKLAISRPATGVIKRQIWTALPTRENNPHLFLTTLEALPIMQCIMPVDSHGRGQESAGERKKKTIPRPYGELNERTVQL